MEKKRIVFLGDSITDAGRNRADCHDMGFGYPKYASELLTQYFSDIDFEFFNKGIGGNRTCQLFDRLYNDAIVLEPDIISILIGINDVWGRYGINRVATTDAQTALNLRCILERIRRETGAKIMILSPYLLDCDDKEQVRADLKTLIPTVRSLAEEFADVYVPLNEIFEEAQKNQPHPKFYSEDGVHPNAAGAEFIGRVYAEAIRPLI